MKTFSLVWCIFIIALVLVICIIQIIDYRKTKNDTTISPEDLKQLKKNNLILCLILGAMLIMDHVDRLFD